MKRTYRFAASVYALQPRLLEEILAVGFVLLTLLVRYYDALAHGYVNAPWADNLYWETPTISQISKLVSEGAGGTWISTLTGGLGVYDTGQFCPAYPFYLFGTIDYGMGLRTLEVLTYLVIGHVFLFSGNTYVMIRTAGGRPIVAAFSAILAAFTENTMMYCGYHMIMAYAWLPLMIAGIIYTLRKPSSLTGPVTLGTAFGMAALAQPGPAVVHSLFLCVIGLIAAIAVYRDWTWLRAFIARLSLAGLIAAGLGLVAVLPTALHLSDTIRWTESGSIIGNQALTWHQFTQSQLNWSDALALFQANHRGFTLGSPYIGLFALLTIPLSLLAFRKSDKPQQVFLAIGCFLVTYGILSAFGSNFIFAHINYKIPIINKLREPERHLVLFVLGASMLSAIGLQRGISLTQSHFRVILPLVSALLLIGIYPETNGLERYLLIAGICSVAVLSLLRPARFAVFAWIALSMAGLYSIRTRSGDTIRAPGQFYASAEYLSQVATLKAAGALPMACDYRFVIRNGGPQGSGPIAMLGGYYGVRSFYSIWNPTRHQQFDDVWNRDLYLNYRRAMGAKWAIVTPTGEPLPGYHTVQTVHGHRIMENQEVSDYLYVTGRIDGSYNTKPEFFENFEKNPFRKNSAYVPSTHSHLLPGIPSRNPAEPVRSEDTPEHIIHWEQRSPDYLRFAIYSPVRALVVLNEYPSLDWVVKIDGHETPLIPVNVGLSGVCVPGGGSVVSFQRKPQPYHWLNLVRIGTSWAVFAFAIVQLGALWKKTDFKPWIHLFHRR